MKKMFGKALAMAVMMSVFCGSAYAGENVENNGTGNNALAIGYGSNASSDNSTAIGSGSNASSDYSTAIGSGSNASSDYSTAIGYMSKAPSNYSTAIGPNATVENTAGAGVAIGNNTKVYGTGGIAIGATGKEVPPNPSFTGIGGQAGQFGVAVGAYASGWQDSVALGSLSTAGKNSEDLRAVAIGYHAKAEQLNSVALGSESQTTEANTVSVGNDTLKRKITNVAAGDISSATSTDAVTGGQIYTMTNVAKGNYIAAGTGVAGNLTALDTQVKINADNIAKKADQTALDDEVKAREQGDADTLKKANQYTDQEIAKISGGASTEALEKLDNKINQTNDRVDRVGATAAALAAINYQPMAKGQSQVAIGMGGYKGKKATAIGMAYQFSDRVSGSVAGSANGSEHMFNVGFNYLFGQHTAKDVAQMAAAPGSMSLKEAELQSEVDSLKAHIAKQDAEMAELKAMVKALAAK